MVIFTSESTEIIFDLVYCVPLIYIDGAIALFPFSAQLSSIQFIVSREANSLSDVVLTLSLSEWNL